MVKPTRATILTQSLAWGRHSGAQRLGHPPPTSSPSPYTTPEIGLVMWGFMQSFQPAFGLDHVSGVFDLVAQRCAHTLGTTQECTAWWERPRDVPRLLPAETYTNGAAEQGA